MKYHDRRYDMIYATSRFKKQYSRLSDELQSNMTNIAHELNSLPIEKQRNYLKRM